MNQITTQDPFPLPRIDELLDTLIQSNYYTTLDLKSGYWQVKLSEYSIAKTAFSTPDGHYEFLRLPFGLKNAPAEFQRIMQSVLGDLNFVKVYLDDIVVHSKTVDDHFSHLEIVLNRLKQREMCMV